MLYFSFLAARRLQPGLPREIHEMKMHSIISLGSLLF